MMRNERNSLDLGSAFAPKLNLLRLLALSSALPLPLLNRITLRFTSGSGSACPNANAIALPAAFRHSRSVIPELREILKI